MTDHEVYEALSDRGISPVELDVWYAGLVTPTSYQTKLYAQGRMLLLASELQITRPLQLQGPPVRMVTIWVDLRHKQVPPACLAEGTYRSRSADPPWSAWLVPATELGRLIIELAEQGYPCRTLEES
jgi:hypothetical protein